MTHVVDYVLQVFTSTFQTFDRLVKTTPKTKKKSYKIAVNTHAVITNTTETGNRSIGLGTSVLRFLAGAHARKKRRNARDELVLHARER